MNALSTHHPFSSQWLAEFKRMADEVIESTFGKQVRALAHNIQRVQDEVDRQGEFYRRIEWINEPESTAMPRPAKAAPVVKYSQPKATSSIPATVIGTTPTTRTTNKPQPVHDERALNSAKAQREKLDAIRKGSGQEPLEVSERLMEGARKWHGRRGPGRDAFLKESKAELSKYPNPTPLLKSVFFDGVNLPPSKPIEAKRFTTPSREEREKFTDAVRIGTGGISAEREPAILRGVGPAIQKGRYTQYCGKIATLLADCDRRSLSPAMQGLLSGAPVVARHDGQGGVVHGPVGFPQVSR